MNKLTMDPADLDKIAATASIFRPDQLKAKTDHFLDALIMQHEALMLELIQQVIDSPDNLYALDQFMELTQSKRQLECVQGLLKPVGCDFERATRQYTDAYVASIRALLASQGGIDSIRARFENLFNDE